MKLLPITVAVTLLGASASHTQDLPEWVLQLSRIKRKAKAEFIKLPNFACLETISRFESYPRSPLWKPLDTIRLEVAFVDGKELFAPVGGASFRELEISTAVHGGAIGTGVFSAVGRNLFVNDNGRTTGWVEERMLERPALRYDFVMPEMLAGYTVQSGRNSGTVGIEGSFWADAETLQLLRVQERAVDIPPGLDIRDTSTTVTFAKTRIGASEVLLPRWAELLVVNLNGLRRRNAIEFSGCREYIADSVIRFDSEEPPPAPPKRK